MSTGTQDMTPEGEGEQQKDTRLSFVEDFFFEYYRYFDENMNNVNFHGYDRELFQAERIEFKTAGLSAIGEHTQSRSLFSSRVRIPAVANQDEMLTFTSTFGLPYDCTDYIKAVDIEGKIFWEFDVMFKEQAGVDPEDERVGYDVLRDLKIQTLLPVFPSESVIHGGLPKNIKNAMCVITFIEKSLTPLTALPLAKLFSETEETKGKSIVSDVFDILATLHENSVTHGDTNLKNWGYHPDKGIFLIDPESLIDFKNIDSYIRKARSTEKGKFVGGFNQYLAMLDDPQSNLPPDQRIRLILEEAVYDDLYRVLSTFKDKDENVILNPHQCDLLKTEAVNYISRVRKAGKMSDELLERVLEEFRMFFDVEALRSELEIFESER